jgi:hypothetical protein
MSFHYNLTLIRKTEKEANHLAMTALRIQAPESVVSLHPCTTVY